MNTKTDIETRWRRITRHHWARECRVIIDGKAATDWARVCVDSFAELRAVAAPNSVRGALLHRCRVLAASLQRCTLRGAGK